MAPRNDAFVKSFLKYYEKISPLHLCLMEEGICLLNLMTLGSDPSNIREIDDLFAFLAARDTAYETRLEELEQEIQTAQANATQTQKAYETALRQLDLAQEELEHLTAAQQREIVLEEYEFFVCNLGTLTPMEYRVYELYLEGKSAKQIAEILGISKNILKYHNKNIYSKLGISSRKQLLRFAALKQHQQSTKTK